MNEKQYKISFQRDYKFVNLVHQNLLQQAIDRYGVDCYYLPKAKYQLGEVDLIFQEVQKKNYSRMGKIRFLITDTSMFSQGENSLFSNFGLVLSDQIRIIITQKEFYERMNTGETIDPARGINQYYGANTQIDYTTIRPAIDDLIYVDQFGGKLFKITGMDEPNTKYSKFNQGTVWELICDVWEASSNDDINVVAETDATTETREFVDIINNIEVGIKAKDLTETDMNSVDETGYDPGSGVIEEDNLNDNYKKESTNDGSDNQVRDKTKNNPFSEF